MQYTSVKQIINKINSISLKLASLILIGDIKCHSKKDYEYVYAYLFCFVPPYIFSKNR